MGWQSRYSVSVYDNLVHKIARFTVTPLMHKISWFTFTLVHKIAWFTITISNSCKLYLLKQGMSSTQLLRIKKKKRGMKIAKKSRAVK